MPATAYFEDILLGHALRQEPFSIDPWYVGLWNSDPGVNGLSGEVDEADYQRRQVTWSSTNDNASDINWGAATSNWGFIVYVVLLDSPQKGTGNILMYDNLPSGFSVSIGEPVIIHAGGLIAALT